MMFSNMTQNTCTHNVIRQPAPKTTRIQDSSYPRLLVPRSERDRTQLLYSLSVSLHVTVRITGPRLCGARHMQPSYMALTRRIQLSAVVVCPYISVECTHPGGVHNVHSVSISRKRASRPKFGQLNHGLHVIRASGPTMMFRLGTDV